MADWRSKLARGLFPTKNRLIGALKKNYCQQHLSRKGRVPFVIPAPNQGFSRLAIVKVLAAAAGVLSVTFYACNVETVPYSKRTRLLLTPSYEMMEREHDRIKEVNKDKVLPDDHPLSVRVRSIKNRLVEALERDLRGDKAWPVWGRFLKRNRELYMDHIKEWETVVIDDPDRMKAKYILSGTIVVYTGLLKILESDAELAGYIAHEIGHVVSHHQAELVPVIRILDMIHGSESLLSTDYSSGWKKISSAQKHPFYLSEYRNLEAEADYIGLQLMASAGYDPSIGRKVLQKIAKLGLSDEDQEEAVVFNKDSQIYYIKHQ